MVTSEGSFLPVALRHFSACGSQLHTLYTIPCTSSFSPCVFLHYVYLASLYHWGWTGASECCGLQSTARLDRNEWGRETFRGQTVMQETYCMDRQTHTYTELWFLMVREEVLWSVLPHLLNHLRAASGASRCFTSTEWKMDGFMLHLASVLRV